MKNPFSLAILTLILASCAEEPPSISDQRTGTGLRVETYRVHPVDLDHVIHATGTLLPGESIDLKAEVSGKLAYIGFEEGKSVSKGELLFLVDDAELKAQLKTVLVDLKLAESDLARNKELKKIQALSQEELDASISKVESLQAQKKLLQARIDRCRVVAPFNAHAGLRYKSPGAFVSSGDILGNLVQTNPLKLEFEVPDKFAHQVQAGQVIRFKSAGSETQYEAKVYAHAGMMDAGSRNLKVRALVVNKEKTLVPGSFVELKLDLGKADRALLVPAESLTPEMGGQKVWVVNEGKLHPHIVETGIRTSTHVQVLSGLNSGDTVITTGLLQARPNAEVSVIKVDTGE